VTTRAGRELSRTEEGREQLERQAEAMREEAEEREREQQRQDIQEQQRREAAQKQEKDEREERERQERQQKAQEKGGAYAGTGPERGRGGRDDDGGGGGGGGKIVCTEMYRQTQLDDWAKAIKIWDVYQKKHLTPYHEKGYHWLFKPYVQGMKKSNLLTKFGAYLAKQRTQHLRHVLTKGRAKDSIVGNIWCKIIHPIVYIAGRIK
jgi:flagellar biosynthesis GTPase FlhF